MLAKPIFLLLLSLGLGYAQQPSGSSLPDGLSETEEQTILKEQNPKPHVEKSLKIAESHLENAVKLAQGSQFNGANGAAQEVDVFSSLIVYADAYTRKLPGNQSKDRNHCLKRIEQTVFKQTRNLEAVMRELPVDTRDALEPKVSEVKKIRLRAINDLLGGGRVINSSN